MALYTSMFELSNTVTAPYFTNNRAKDTTAGKKDPGYDVQPSEKKGNTFAEAKDEYIRMHLLQDIPEHLHSGFISMFRDLHNKKMISLVRRDRFSINEIYDSANCAVYEVLVEKNVEDRTLLRKLCAKFPARGKDDLFHGNTVREEFSIAARGDHTQNHAHKAFTKKPLLRGDDYMLSEKATGDLEQMSDEFRTAPAHVRIALASQATFATLKMSKEHILHRDIKPANLVIDQNGIVKVIDFGAARYMPNEETFEDHMPSTALYMSPEQSMNISHPTMDTYSLGQTLWTFFNRTNQSFLLDHADQTDFDSAKSVFTLRAVARNLYKTTMDPHESIRTNLLDLGLGEKVQKRVENIFIGMLHPSAEKRMSLAEAYSAWAELCADVQETGKPLGLRGIGQVVKQFSAKKKKDEELKDVKPRQKFAIEIQTTKVANQDNIAV